MFIFVSYIDIFLTREQIFILVEIEFLLLKEKTK